MAIILTQYQGKILGPIAWVLGKVMNAIFVILNTIGIPNVGLCIFIFTVITNNNNARIFFSKVIQSS